MRFFLILSAFLFAQSIISLRDGFAFLRYVRRCHRRPSNGYTPSVAVILPCKGLDLDFDRNVAALMAQDYPQYQLIFVVASEHDPAWPRLAEVVEKIRAKEAGCGSRAALVVAGRSDIRGEKVNNILHGLRAVDRQAEVLVFADADAFPKPDWLRSLVAPLADPAVTVSTGFRWYLAGRTFASRLRAAWDTSIATTLGDHESDIAWGGAMAIRVADFRRLRIAEDYWASTASDDYAVRRAVRQAGGHIRFEPRCLMASREESTVGEFIRWANRQVILTRVYAARLWATGLAWYVLYCGTFLFGLVLLALPSSSQWARVGVALALGLILAAGLAKARIRSIVAREIFPKESAGPVRDDSCYWKLAPLVPWVMLVNFVTAGLTRRIEWRGVHYDLRSTSEVRVLRRN